MLDDSVVDVTPLFDKTLLKMVDTNDTGTVDTSLQHVPYLVVDRIKILAVGWP